MLILADGSIIKTDENGYLLNLDEWEENVAHSVAEHENIQLTEDHWQVIYFLRNFYQTYQTTPQIRILVKELAKKVGAEKGNSIYLHQLFPQGVLKQSCKIAGLPKPTKCI